MNPQIKKKPYRSKKYLEHIRTQPCLAAIDPDCHGDIVYHHEAVIDGRGVATKCGDDQCVPLCDYHHKLRESQGFMTFWGRVFLGDGEPMPTFDKVIITMWLLKFMHIYMTDFLQGK